MVQPLWPQGRLGQYASLREHWRVWLERMLGGSSAADTEEIAVQDGSPLSLIDR